MGEGRSIERRSGLQAQSDKEICIRYIDEMEEKEVFGWKGVAEKKVACIEEGIN